jgi:hypothetical protein
MNAIVSKHAKVRMQQRGITPASVDYLLDFGSEHHDHHGAVIMMLDRRAARRIARSGAATRAHLASMRGLYAVIGADGKVSTVGHRTRRIRRT